MRNIVVALASTVLLAGCAASREEQAAEACGKEIQTRLAGRNYEVSAKDLAAHAAAEGPDILRLASTIVFDKGLSSEYRQTVDCRVRFENGKPPAVIFLQFNWSMDDVKKG